MIGMNALGSNGRLGNQMFQYAALVGIAKNLGYDYCIPDHSKVTWFDRMEGDEIITQHHQLQHLFEMNNLGDSFGLSSLVRSPTGTIPFSLHICLMLRLLHWREMRARRKPPKVASLG